MGLVRLRLKAVKVQFLVSAVVVELKKSSFSDQMRSIPIHSHVGVKYIPLSITWTGLRAVRIAAETVRDVLNS